MGVPGGLDQQLSCCSRVVCAAQSGKRKTFCARDVIGSCSYISETIFCKGDEQQQLLQSPLFDSSFWF